MELFNLPKYVILPILIEWLMVELCFLDTAMCNTTKRAMYLEWLGGPSSYTFSGSIHESVNGPSYWKWLSYRKIHVHHVSLFFEYFAPYKEVKSTLSLWDRIFFFATCRSTKNWVRIIETPKKYSVQFDYFPSKVNSLNICALRNRDVYKLHAIKPHNLEILSLTHFEINSILKRRAIISFITGNCTFLKELTIHDCDNLPTLAIKQILQECSELTYLSLLESKVYPADVYPDGHFDWQVNCTKLKYLSIYQLSYGCDELVSRIVVHCPALQHICLLMMRINTESIIQTAQSCRQLISIAVDTFGTVKHEAFEEIAACCSELEYFNLQPYVTYSQYLDGIYLIIENCKKLKILSTEAHYSIQQQRLPKDLIVKESHRLSGWYPPYIPSSNKLN